MNAGADMKDDAGMDEAAGMDAQQAAAIMQQARERARRELAVRRPVLFVTWGLVVLIGYGVMWLSVRGQHPFHGPTAPAIVTLVALVLGAAVYTTWFVDRVSSGVGGPSVLQRGIFVLAMAAGAFTVDVFIHVLSHAGADRPLVALMGAAAPLLVVGLVFTASCAVSGMLDWPRLAVGLWLLAVAAEGGWAGPVTYLAVIALAGGGGILLMAAIEPLLRRS
ncbi:MAG TPA: hypothetical protein VG123_39625 [Streptosporangiaceae bacterium]|jgi:hypothetical protein|nr:hypothetical protein [Streptosporangiaceae bacterium]